MLILVQVTKAQALSPCSDPDLEDAVMLEMTPALSCPSSWNVTAAQAAQKLADPAGGADKHVQRGAWLVGFVAMNFLYEQNLDFSQLPCDLVSALVGELADVVKGR